ncbi:MAG: GntR family transcriptional regulator [Pseudarthrobacter sp.]|nr:GntR family transcriptional regulator [Pseudarthrobacter sp.]
MSCKFVLVDISGDSKPGAGLDFLARRRVEVPAVASRVAAELRRQLAAGQWAPGTRLNEPTIAEELGVSRNTLREAFAELAAERLVDRLPNRGVFVAAPGAADLKDFYTVRRLIEVGAVRAGGTPDGIAAVENAVAAGRAAAASGDLDGLADANLHFHRCIVELAESPRLNVLMSQVLAEMRLFFHKESVDVAFYSSYLSDNTQIAARLAASDFAGAGDLLLDYLDRSERHLLAIHGGQEMKGRKR